MEWYLHRGKLWFLCGNGLFKWKKTVFKHRKQINCYDFLSQDADDDQGWHYLLRETTTVASLHKYLRVKLDEHLKHLVSLLQYRLRPALFTDYWQRSTLHSRPHVYNTHISFGVVKYDQSRAEQRVNPNVNFSWSTNYGFLGPKIL